MEISVENLETPAEAVSEQPEIQEEKSEIQEETEEIQEEIPEIPPLTRQPKPRGRPKAEPKPKAVPKQRGRPKKSRDTRRASGARIHPSHARTADFLCDALAPSLRRASSNESGKRQTPAVSGTLFQRLWK